jgi:hypothetical protein
VGRLVRILAAILTDWPTSTPVWHCK